MIRMLILGCVSAVRSERQLCREVQVNLAYRWSAACAQRIGAGSELRREVAKNASLHGDEIRHQPIEHLAKFLPFVLSHDGVAVTLTL